MEKFLYVFNYPPEDKDLCALEFRAMFKQEYTSKYYLSNKDYDVNKLHTKTLIKYIASTIKNDNRSIVDILNNDLLNPTVNGFKLLNNISKLPLINNESYELWFSGQCIMVSCSIMYECKELALKQ